MAYDAKIEMRVGERKMLFAQSSVDAGTLTVQPGGTLTLTNTAGTVVLGPVGITGYTQTPEALVEVWYDFDSAAYPDAVYVASFDYSAVASDDSATRTDLPTVQVKLLPIVEIVATYDITSLVGQTRFHAADTDVADPIWSDAELSYCLTQTESSVMRAAAMALRAAAVDRAKIALIVRKGTLSRDRTKVPELLRMMASDLEAQDSTGGSIEAPDEIFSTDTDDGETVGTMTGW